MNSLAAAAVHAEDQADGQVEWVEGLLDVERLASWGWDPKAQVLVLDPEHPVLGYQLCAVASCRLQTASQRPLCQKCHAAWRTTSLSIDEFVAASPPSRKADGLKLCVVCRTPGHERVARRNGLCMACENQRHWRGQSVQAFVGGDGEFPPAEPQPSFGACRIVACTRLAVGGRGLCQGHVNRWIQHDRPDLDHFCRSTTALMGDRSARLMFAGLPRLAQAELLYGLQASVDSGRRWRPYRYRAVIDALRRSGEVSIRQLDTATLPGTVRTLARQTIDALDLAAKTLETERLGDVWDLRVWGLRGFVRFAGGPGNGQRRSHPAPAIHQAWLRAVAKEWAYTVLSRSRRAGGLRLVLNAVGSWSEHLRERNDRGEQLSALDKDHMTAYLAHLWQQARSGRISASAHHALVRNLRRFLRDIREDGLTRPGGLAHGLPEDVAIHPSEVPRRPDPDPEDEVGEAISEAVVAQLLDPVNLERLAPEARRRFLVGLATGRRPAELCGLALDCLEYDDRIDETTTRAPVLVHDMPKVSKVQFRLPVDQHTAHVIGEQQAAVVERYPRADRRRLRLFPAPVLNPAGDKPYSAGKFAAELRAWADSLSLFEGWLTPDRRLVVLQDHEGNPVRFEGSRIHPYALRHTFSQLRVNAGVAVHELAALLGHDNLRTTQAYYRITAKMKRAAMERVAPLQLGADGGRLSMAGDPSPSDVLRYAVGQVAVPFGVCVEPSNVAAHGQGCPFRHRCFGCKHFRTDPSYLPELRSHRDRLLADRERLLATIPDLADWARRDALPSDAEVDAVRRLIHRCEEVLDELSEDDRRAVERASADLREARHAMNTTFPVEFRGVATQSHPTVFPRAALEANS